AEYPTTILTGLSGYPEAWEIVVPVANRAKATVKALSPRFLMVISSRSIGFFVTASRWLQELTIQVLPKSVNTVCCHKMMKYANIQLGGVHGGAKLQQQQEGAEMFRTLAIPQSLDTPGTINTVENLAVTLRDYLVSLPVKGGERLYEANIAKELGVSRPM